MVAPGVPQDGTQWTMRMVQQKVFQTSYMKVGVKKLLRPGMVPARTCGVHAVGMALTERLKFRRQMAAAAGKKGHDLVVFVHQKSFGLEVEEDLSPLATQYCPEGV